MITKRPGTNGIQQRNPDESRKMTQHDMREPGVSVVSTSPVSDTSLVSLVFIRAMLILAETPAPSATSRKRQRDAMIDTRGKGKKNITTAVDILHVAHTFFHSRGGALGNKTQQ